MNLIITDFQLLNLIHLLIVHECMNAIQKVNCVCGNVVTSKEHG